jgi:DNA polymerase IIIc chi subunit
MSACIFHDTDAASRDRRLFEIVERAYNQHEKVVVFAATEARAAAIDRTLWILRQEAFIPHKIISSHESEFSVPVAIVTAEWNPLQAGILVVDGHCSLEFALGFDLIHEFVDRSSPEIHEECRNRFRAYRAKQIPVEHLK